MIHFVSTRFTTGGPWRRAGACWTVDAVAGLVGALVSPRGAQVTLRRARGGGECAGGAGEAGGAVGKGGEARRARRAAGEAFLRGEVASAADDALGGDGSLALQAVVAF